jgi:hypothetical protein
MVVMDGETGKDLKGGGRDLFYDSRRWKNNIKIHLGEMGLECCRVDASDSVCRPVAVPCKHGKKLSVFMKGGEFLD